MNSNENNTISIECNTDIIKISNCSMFISPEGDKIYIVIRKCGFMKYSVIQGDKVEKKPYGWNIHTENTYITLVDEDKYSAYYEIYNGFKTVDAYEILRCRLVHSGDTTVAVETLNKILNSWILGTGLEVIKSRDKDKNIISTYDGRIKTTEIKNISETEDSEETVSDSTSIEDNAGSNVISAKNNEEYDPSKNESLGEDQIVGRWPIDETHLKKIKSSANKKDGSKSVINFGVENESGDECEGKAVENPFGAGNGGSSGNKMTVEYLKEIQKKRLAKLSDIDKSEKDNKSAESGKRTHGGKEYKTRPFSVDYGKIDDLLKNTDMTYEQIASEVGCSKCTVYNRESEVKIRANKKQVVDVSPKEDDKATKSNRSRKIKLDGWLKDGDNMEKFKAWAADETISLEAVAKKIGCSTQTVRNTIDRLGIKYVAVPKKKGLKHKSVIND